MQDLRHVAPKPVRSALTSATMSQDLVLPRAYYLLFRYCEPILATLAFILSCANPKAVSNRSVSVLWLFASPIWRQEHDNNGPWSTEDIPVGPLTSATRTTVIQYKHVVFLISALNFYVLGAVHQHLTTKPALQEKVVSSYLQVLLFGDVVHMAISLWCWGDGRWAVTKWNAHCWAAVILGLSLAIPRLLWVLGIGRYVHDRDEPKARVKMT
jgi:hypothetical protein